MSYASDTDDAEQCAQGEEHGRGETMSDFEKMLSRFGYSGEDWAYMSNNERAQIAWNWRMQKKSSKP